MKYSYVTCGECGTEAYYVVCEWPPKFYWCRGCGRIFVFEKVDGSDGAIWQLRGYPQHD